MWTWRSGSRLTGRRMGPVRVVPMPGALCSALAAESPFPGPTEVASDGKGIGWATVGHPRSIAGLDPGKVYGDYVMTTDAAEAARIHEIDHRLVACWGNPILIEFTVDGPLYIWQITGIAEDCNAIAEVMRCWGKGSDVLDPVAPDLRSAVIGIVGKVGAGVLVDVLVRAVRRRHAPKVIPHKHLRLHKVADRQGSWICHYCGVALVDVCSDADMVYDSHGKRMLAPGCTKRFPTLDHLVPQALGGSHAVKNLVLACQPCNSRKGAQ